MADRPQGSTSRILTLFLLAIFGAIAWFLAPFFLPMYRWMKVDFAKEAQAATSRGFPCTEDQLKTVFDVEVAYHPRGDNDPRPFVLMRMTPDYFSVYPDDNWSWDEESLALRIVFIGDRTGTPPSDFNFGGGTYQHRYFKAKAWRFQPDSLGFKTEERPVILYDEMTLDKFSIGEAQVRHEQLINPRIWTPDDDGYEPPSAAAE